MSKVPQYHHDLLDKKIAGLHGRDEASVIHYFETHDTKLPKDSYRAYRQLDEHLQAIYKLLKNPPADFPKVKRDTAVAALVYFFHVDDHISDDHHGDAGVVDDILVVEAAVERLKFYLDL